MALRTTRAQALTHAAHQKPPGEPITRFSGPTLPRGACVRQDVRHCATAQRGSYRLVELGDRAEHLTHELGP
jgi:hypothetical protein